MLSRHICFAALLPTHVLGLIGYGIKMYNPSCAFACGDAISPAPLGCSVEGHEEGHHSHGGGLITTPECRSQDESFLTTLAWCMNERCEQVQVWRLERYWGDKATGDVNVAAKWAYIQALAAATVPSSDLDVEVTLNGTLKTPFDQWDAQKRTLEAFERQETFHSLFG
jgi:hypothetical protein